MKPTTRAHFVLCRRCVPLARARERARGERDVRGRRSLDGPGHERGDGRRLTDIEERVCAADERDPEGRLLEDAAPRRVLRPRLGRASHGSHAALTRVCDVVGVLLARLRVRVGVMERVERQVAGDWEAEAAVIEVVDDLDRDFVGAGIPEEGDLEAVLVAVGEFFGGCVRHRGSFLFGEAAI